jgi:hypothetical protein
MRFLFSGLVTEGGGSLEWAVSSMRGWEAGMGGVLYGSLEHFMFFSVFVDDLSV